MSKIAWTGKTWNPIVGCRKVSPGCQNCYAERMAFRLAHMGQANYQQVVDSAGWNGRVALCSEKHWDNIPKRGMCFVCSMGDLFYEKVKDWQICDVYCEMLKHHKTTFQVLTKLPERALAYYQKETPGAAPNIWFGTTCENQPWADKRLPILLQIPAAVRFVSFEPLLGPVDPAPWLWERYMGPDKGQQALNWVIIGCESGPGRRPCKIEWVRSIAQKCWDADVPLFVKQINLKGKVVHDPEIIAAELGTTVERIRQFPERKES